MWGNMSKLLPLLSQLGKYLKAGMDHYAQLKAAGEVAGPDLVAAYIAEKMEDWDPQVNGISLLDDETKGAGARFLAGVAINFSQV